MLRAAPVLVLDKPTTGLDSVAARQIVQPLRRLMTGRAGAAGTEGASEDTLVLRV